MKVFVDNVVASNSSEDINDENLIEDNLINTGVYSDFYTNKVEGLWSQLKRLTHTFTGIIISLIN